MGELIEIEYRKILSGLNLTMNPGGVVNTYLRSKIMSKACRKGGYWVKINAASLFLATMIFNRP